MNLGKMKISEGMKHLNPIAKAYGLKLNRLEDFRLAKFILNQLYNSIA